ncbi:MAG TPA: Holliday junction branch migration protein RuvA [Acidimicrobiales bacterium]|nr:Holliday junction branch migration protein RuvA [Acidimicrobiales bacterium]
MIGHLRGALLDRGASDVTIEVAGIGYRVTVTPTTVVALGDLGEEVACWIHHHQREDAVTLYGFATKDERTCFEALIGAHGVGPALALAILSVHSPSALARILAEEDLGALCLVPGVGKKTAQRLLIDLRSRLSIPDLSDAPVGTGAAGAPLAASSARVDVRDALGGLGYTDGEIREVMADLPDDGDAPALLRDALQRLGSVRR